MGFIETSYGNSPNLSDVHIDSNLNMDTFGISAGGAVSLSGGLDLNNTDLIGVKRFMCADFLGAVKANASDNTQWTLNLGNTSVSYAKSLKFRVPSNFIESTIKISYSVSTIISTTTGVEKYDPETSTYTTVFSKSTAANTSETITTNALTVLPGEIYCLFKGGGNAILYGATTGILCDLSAVTGGYWEIE